MQQALANFEERRLGDEGEIVGIKLLCGLCLGYNRLTFWY